ncbi:MAG: acetyl-CoA carboxylase carboxyltransferase subunit alpha [Gemmatimonadota bacterium]|nr:MAG: acetyl-CoA carboxylase carboxyltransferase subunit alpha [Gemmatimonadota bacterium]
MNETGHDFERKIIALRRELDDVRARSLDHDPAFKDDLKQQAQKLEKAIRDIHSKLNRWQRVLLARHPQRPYTMDYIRFMITDFVELHGDRLFADDKAIVGGLGKLAHRTVVIVGHQKGRSTKENLYRNFGMANPEGYRKALRLMRLAAKYKRPVVCLIDTPGAYPGIGAEERGQAEAIARNLFEMSRLPVPIIVVVIGEGASGGALGIGVGDRLLMMENTWYSVISPEGCASILWRSAEKKEQAAEALKLTPQDLMVQGLIDEIIPEPLGGAHFDHEEAASILKRTLERVLGELGGMPPQELLDKRIEKFSRMGLFQEPNAEKEETNVG